jgi:tetratricopeptide (TPR) repeat protein
MSEPPDTPRPDTPRLITLAGDQDAQPAFTPATPASTRESVRPPTIDPGEEVGGRYRLGEEIARGGMGVVYAARDLVLDRDIGLKTLRQSPPAGSPLARRFREEARITGQLQHPGIPPVHDLGALADGRPFLAMKLIKGRTLADLLGERPGPSHDRARFVAVFEQICQAVGYAHAHRVIHRDLKPANVMVGAFGEVQVMDWGLAKVLTEGRSAGPGPEEAPGTEIRSPRDAGEVTQAGAVVGTPAFMPREQAIGAVDQVDERSDVFGLGAVLCTILTGEPPYVAPSGEAARQMAAVALLGGAFARLDACGAEPELVALCKRCLAAEKADRPRDGEEVAGAVAALRAAADERARRAEVERERAEVRAAEQRKRFRLRLALAGAVLLLVAGGGAFAWWRDRQAAEQSLADERRMSAEFRAETEADKARTEAENARSGVHALLAAATDLRRRYQFEDAAVALDQAKRLTAKGAAGLRPVVERAKADLAFVRRLDDIRMKRSTWIAEPGGKGDFDLARAVEDYPEAFRSAGLDVLGADPGVVAAAVIGSPIRAELIAALDDWSALPLDVPILGRVLDVLRRADPGPWQDAFRDPAVRRSAMALGLLARSADPANLPPATLTALSELMGVRGLDPGPLLLRAQFAHPGDFLISFALGQSATDAAEKMGHYRAARVTRPGNLTVLINLGIVLYAKGDVDGAVTTIMEVLKHDAKFAPAHNNLGNVLALKGDPDGAIAAYKRAIEHDAKFAPAHNNLGSVLYAKGDPDGAIAAYKEAIRLNPKFAKAHCNLGGALKKKGDPDGAIAAYRRAIEHDPKLAHAHTGLGIVLYAKGDPDGAIAAFNEAIRLDPKFALAHYSLGIALDARGDIDGAIAAYKRAIEHDPKYAPAHINLGDLYRNQKNYPEAIACARAAIQADPKQSNAHAMLGHLLQLTGDIPGARVALTEAARLDPRWKPLLAKLPPVAVAPPPRPVPPRP